MFKTAFMVGCLLCSPQLSADGQGERERWERVYTGEDSLVDINALSLTFEAGHVLRVIFRTTLSKPESVGGKPGTKYKSRLETIEFKSNEKRFRFREISLLDSSGKTVQSYEANAEGDWRVLKDFGAMYRLFHAVSQLSPFGYWKVVDYRFGEGAPANAKDLQRLLGTRVRLHYDNADVGPKVCTALAYQSKPVTDKEFLRELGISLSAIGIKKDYADTIVVKCETNGWAPPQSLLVKLPEGGILMLWDGVFLVLKKERW